jgi:hypothetical protein
MKAAEMRAFVLNAYLDTGKHVFVSQLMEQFNTSASNVRKALGYDDFVFEEADRWQGSNFSGKYVLAPCVEPTKTYLAKLLKAKS